MAEDQPSFAHIVSEQLRTNLSDVRYKHCIHILSEMQNLLLSPNMFREKMKFLCRQHTGLLVMLNPLLPDDYQFTDEELGEEARDYRELEASIKFVNELVKRADYSEELGNFYKLVKSRKRKNIDDAEFYGSAYKYLRGDFDLMKKLGNVLKYETTPSYIKLPTLTGASGEEDDQVLNNRYRIYSHKACVSTNTIKERNYIYSPDKVLKRSRERPLRASSEKRKPEAVEWWESRSSELELVLGMLTVAAKEVESVLGKMERGTWLVNAKLKEYLMDKGVKVKLLEMMKFGELEELTQERLPGVGYRLMQKREEVVEAIRQLNQMRQRQKI